MLCIFIHFIFIQRGEAKARLAISDLNSSSIHVYDVRSGTSEPMTTLQSIHRTPVVALKYNPVFDTVISADDKVRSVIIIMHYNLHIIYLSQSIICALRQGFIEYWSATTYEPPGSPAVIFNSKLDTDLFDVAKAKAAARSIQVKGCICFHAMSVPA